ncbi:MAG: SPASM domain-containing protein [Methylococcales bacterium]|nr:SPASM domain-containing protein [Methylococcales bacterium]
MKILSKIFPKKSDCTLNNGKTITEMEQKTPAESIKARYNATHDDFPDIKNPKYPEFYWLDLGNLCNLRCPFCQTGKNLPLKRGFLNRSNFDIILDKIGKHAKFISLINWGEPFLNKDLLYFFSRCEKLGIRTHIDSNLSFAFLSKQEAEEIVTSGIDVILGSIDGATQEGYSKYRVKGNLDMVLQNLRLLRLTRDELGLDKPFLGWSFLINKFNEDEIDQATAMADDIGVDIWFKLLSCEDPSWRSKYHDTPDHPVLKVPEWVARVYPIGLPESLVTQPLHSELTCVCYQPFSSMIINWNGDVYPCCVVFGDNYKLGNLITQEFDEVWFGEKYENSRAFLRHYGPPQTEKSVCRDESCPLKKKSL